MKPDLKSILGVASIVATGVGAIVGAISDQRKEKEARPRRKEAEQTSGNAGGRADRQKEIRRTVKNL